MTTNMQQFDFSHAPGPDVPSLTWRTLAHAQPAAELPKGFDAVWDRALGLCQRLKPRRSHFLARADLVLALEKDYRDLTDARLKEKAADMRATFRTGKDTPTTVLHALAIVREVAARIRNEKPYREQVAGALALHAGCITEMATGEGKTLTATMPATLAGWRGRGCHVITVNDYLAKRDAQSMSPIYAFCGLTTGYVVQEQKPPERRDAYLADITYLTNKEACADFLRDRLTLGKLRDVTSAMLGKIIHGAGTDRLVQRGLHFAIVDEADSVLIDEAVTPLIISGDAPNAQAVAAYQQAAQLAAQLEPVKHFTSNHRYREVELTDEGFDHVSHLAQPYGGIWNGARRREELILQALTAREFYILGKQYIVDPEAAKEKEGRSNIVIVDEFTGRLMPDRTWRDGLHQAIEAKENVTVNPPKDTFSRVSFQRFFRFYHTLSGMSGTVREAATEAWQIYHRPIVVIPTHKPCIRTELPDRVYATTTAKYAAIVADIKRIHATGRPILIGTRSVRASEILAQELSAQNLPHAVLNAVRHAEEAQIIAGAGQPGRITVSTNMAGRGTDIKLGRGVAELGGLHVIATERHEAKRVDRQLFGRSGRQGDPGTSQAFVSLEDELVVRYTPKLAALLRKRHGHTTAELHGKLVHKLFDLAQNRAQRLALSQRKGVLRSDDWLDESLGFAGSER